MTFMLIIYPPPHFVKDFCAFLRISAGFTRALRVSCELLQASAHFRRFPRAFTLRVSLIALMSTFLPYRVKRLGFFGDFYLIG